MRYILFTVGLLILSLLLNQSALAQERPADGMLSYQSEYSVDETMKRLVSQLKDNNMKIFQTVDHSAGAKSVNMELPATKLIIFGNPKAGTPLMQCVRTVAVDLPQKMLIWKKDGDVHIGYNDPMYLDMRHQLGDDCEKAVDKVSKALENFATYAAGVDQ